MFGNVYQLSVVSTLYPCGSASSCALPYRIRRTLEISTVTYNRATEDLKSRLAIVYVRQSSPQQVLRNTGSTEWQRSFKQIALDLGWSEERVVIFEDLGRSSAFGQQRDEFRNMLELIRLERVGIVLITDQTRSARNDADWGLLTELMAINGTLLYCGNELFDLNNPSDRMMLGITQTLAVADSQQLRRKIYESTLARAKTGTLKIRLPVGYVYKRRHIYIDENPKIRDSIKSVFETFRHLGSIYQVTKYFCSNDLLIPRRKVNSLIADNEINWVIPKSHMILSILGNPTYSGTYTYGRRQTKVKVLDDYSTKHSHKRIMNFEEWHTCIPGAFEGYITWEEFQNNQKQIRSNSFSVGLGSARSGSALLQGLVVCGKCGHKMSVSYPAGNPYYQCQWANKNHGEKMCQSFAGKPVENVVLEAVLHAMKPGAIAIVMRIQEKFFEQKRKDAIIKADNIKSARSNKEESYRILAAALSIGTNDDLIHELEQKWIDARAEYLKAERESSLALDEIGTPMSEKTATLLSELAVDLPMIFMDDRISMTDRKNVLRCIIESVEIKRDGSDLYVVIRWHSGTISSFLTSVRHSKNPEKV